MESPITVENGSFRWGNDEPTVLENINVNIKQGSLTAVSIFYKRLRPIYLTKALIIYLQNFELLKNLNIFCFLQYKYLNDMFGNL